MASAWVSRTSHTLRVAATGIQWASADGSAHEGAAGFGDAEVRELLHTALRLRQGRVSTVMPQQVGGSFSRLQKLL